MKLYPPFRRSQQWHDSRSALPILLSLVLVPTAPLWGLLTEIAANPLPDATAVDLQWQAYPSQTYQVLTSTNCTAWSNATPAGVRADSVIGAAQFSDSRPQGFYRVDILDVDPPAVSPLSPVDAALDVAHTTALQIGITDRTGIDSNSLSLKVGQTGTYTLTDPQLAWSDGVLTFIPDVPLGKAGEIVLNSLHVHDTLGHPRDYDWSFQLAQPPVVTNTILILDGSTLSTLSQTADQLTFSYADAPPAVADGTLLANAAALSPLYREVESVLGIDATASTISVATAEAALPQFMQSGSLSGASFTNLQIHCHQDLAGQPLVNTTTVTGLLSSGEWDLDLTLNLACLLDHHALQTFTLGATGTLRVALQPEIHYLDASLTNAASSIYSQVFIERTQVGGVPVWLRVTVDTTLGGDYQSDAAGSLGFATATTEEISAGVALRSYNWRPQVQSVLAETQCEPVATSLTTNHTTTLFIEPSVTVEIYGLAGAALLLRSEVKARHTAAGGPAQPVLTLSHGLNSTVTPTSARWLPEWGASPPQADRQQTWALGGVATAPPPPSFATLTSNITVEAGMPLVMEALVQGAFPATYSWFFDGNRVPFADGHAFAIANAQSGHEGVWTVEARNAQGMAAATFQVAVLETITPPAPGMQPITGGTNHVVDPDFGSYSLAVDSFYMDQSEISKAEWDHVYAWAVRYGYSFETAGAGKAATHPVQGVTWHACAKWCNARSEMEGLTPYYRLTNGTIYRAGTYDPDAALSADGYRLPSHDEWEYAARAGASSNRFPWGATITHAAANYYSYDGLAYDVSPTRGYHPAYATDTPFTAPTDSGAANANGLVGLSGNVWEWCDDQSAGQRAIRGGSWYSSAAYGRCGDRRWELPAQNYDDYGFAVCAPTLEPGGTSASDWIGRSCIQGAWTR